MFDQFRVYLRALEPDDYKTSINWRNDEEIWDMIVGPRQYVSEAYEKKWVEDAIFNSSNRIVLAVCIKETDKHIGFVYLNNIDMKIVMQHLLNLSEIKSIGKRFGKEATILMLYHGFMY